MSMKGTMDVRCPAGHVNTIPVIIVALSDDRQSSTVVAGSAQDFCETCDVTITEPGFNVTVPS